MNERLKKYICFDEQPQKGKTKIWLLWNQASGEICGQIKWYGGWRKYIFETVEKSRIYDWDFMRAVAEFCENETHKHYGKR